MERADERLEKYHKEKVKGDSLTQEEKIKNITERLEKGIKELFESDRYTTFLKVMSKFHNYSFNNSLLIAMHVQKQRWLLAILRGRETFTEM